LTSVPAEQPKHDTSEPDINWKPQNKVTDHSSKPNLHGEIYACCTLKR